MALFPGSGWSLSLWLVASPWVVVGGSSSSPPSSTCTVTPVTTPGPPAAVSVLSRALTLGS
eukprot:scaffold13150_cov62-Phaeocystis_antarctica.AAC.2